MRLKKHQDGNQITNLPRVTKCDNLCKVKVNINFVVQMGKRRKLESSYWYYILNREREKPIFNEAVFVFKPLHLVGTYQLIVEFLYKTKSLYIPSLATFHNWNMLQS